MTKYLLPVGKIVFPILPTSNTATWRKKTGIQILQSFLEKVKNTGKPIMLDAGNQMNAGGTFCYNLTSLNSYGKDNDFIEYTYNHNRKRLLQINLAILSGRSNSLPFWYTSLLGSLNDSKPLINLESSHKEYYDTYFTRSYRTKTCRKPWAVVGWVHTKKPLLDRLFMQFIAVVILTELKKSIKVHDKDLVKYGNYHSILKRVASFSQVRFPGKYKDVYTSPTKEQEEIFTALGIDWLTNAEHA